jgi:hypothetical protein
LLSNQFVARVAPPEINAADLEKFTGSAAKELNERSGIGTLRGLGRDTEEKFLKSFVGAGQGAAFRRRRRITPNYVQSATKDRLMILAILTSD